MKSDSSDDFFNSFGNSPPTKQAAVGGPRRSSAGVGAPPPPPPKRTTGPPSSAAASGSFSQKNKPPPPQKSRPNNQPPLSSSRPTSAPTNTTTARTSNTSATAAGITSRRPVGNYYPTSTTTQNDPVNGAPTTNTSTTTTTTPAFYPQPGPHFSQGTAYSSSSSAPNSITASTNPSFFRSSRESSTDSLQLQGAMDAAPDETAPPQLHSSNAQPSFFIPQPKQEPKSYHNDLMEEDELPLLEELGINIDHIVLKTKAVVIPSQRLAGKSNTALMDPSLIVEDADLAGPLAFALLLGAELLLSGKIHFGYIYGFGLFGCLSMTLILNLMSPQPVSIWTVTSILGYSLLPVNILAALKIVLVNIARLSTLGRILALLTILWSTVASTRLLEVGCRMRAQRYLLAYPIALLYSAFVLITIF